MVFRLLVEAVLVGAFLETVLPDLVLELVLGDRSKSASDSPPKKNWIYLYHLTNLNQGGEMDMDMTFCKRN